MTASFQILPISLFTSQPTIDTVLSEILAASQNTPLKKE
jgi:hypothetical protein